VLVCDKEKSPIAKILWPATDLKRPPRLMWIAGLRGKIVRYKAIRLEVAIQSNESAPFTVEYTEVEVSPGVDIETFKKAALERL
jgi:hypothetical protein